MEFPTLHVLSSFASPTMRTTKYFFLVAPYMMLLLALNNERRNHKKNLLCTHMEYCPDLVNIERPV